MQEAAQTLMTAYTPAVARDLSLVEVAHFTGERAKNRAMHDIHEAIRATRDAVRPGPGPTQQAMDRLVGFAADLIARGVRCREIYPLSYLQSRRLSRYLSDLANLGVQVRQAAADPQSLQELGDGPLHGTAVQAHSAGDLIVAQAAGEEAEDGVLLPGEPGFRGGLLVRDRAQPRVLEHRHVGLDQG
jgi:hypothetical protein